MRFVVACAFRRALASLVLCFGLLALLWTLVVRELYDRSLTSLGPFPPFSFDYLP